MTIETAFKAMLDAALARSPSIVYPVYAPQGYEQGGVIVTYQVITAPRDYTQEGADGVTTFRIQTDLYGATYSDLLTLRDLLTAAMSGAYNQTWDGLKIQGCFIDNERDLSGGEFDTPGPRVFRKSIDWMVTAAQG